MNTSLNSDGKQNRPHYMALEIKYLAWDRHKKCGLLDDNFLLSTRFVNITSLLLHWSLPPIPVDTISRDVTRIKTYF